MLLDCLARRKEACRDKDDDNADDHRQYRVLVLPSAEMQLFLQLHTIQGTHHRETVDDHRVIDWNHAVN